MVDETGKVPATASHIGSEGFYEKTRSLFGAMTSRSAQPVTESCKLQLSMAIESGVMTIPFMSLDYTLKFSVIS